MPNHNPTESQLSGTTIVSIGGGNMAAAILLGAVNAGVLQSANIIVADPSEDRRSIFTARNIATFASASDALHHNATEQSWAMAAANLTILLAIKPQMLDAVASQTRDAIALAASRHTGNISIVSILAGVTLERLTATFNLPAANVHYIRVMPNTPALVGKGMAAICADANVPTPLLENVRTLFAALGDVITLDESLMDAFTAIAGSGPAYLFFLAEALEHAAQHLGFDDHTAARIAKQTITGSATLLEQSEDSPATLRQRVTSPAGTTAAAIDVLEQHNLTETLKQAVTAARNRGRELSAGD